MHRLPDPQRARIHAAVDALLDALLEPAEPAPPPAPALDVRLVDKREAARALAVSVATIDRLDREGQPFVRVGDAKRYDLAAVLAWHRDRPASDAPASPPALPPASGTGQIKILTRPTRKGRP
jgi:hypothetical protein